MTPQTVGQDRTGTRAAAPDVPSQRAAAQVIPDPLVGPPVAREEVEDALAGRTDGVRAAAGTTRTADRGPDGAGARRAGHRAGHGADHADHQAELGAASTGELVRRLSTQVSELVRGEMELARAELTEKGKRAGAGAGLAGAGGVVALYGVGAVIAAVIAALSLAMPVWASALIVGIALLLVGGVLALAGRSRLRRATPPVPEETVESVHRDVETIKEAVHR